MRRTAFIALALAALAAALAAGEVQPASRTATHHHARSAARARHASTSHRPESYRTEARRTIERRPEARRSGASEHTASHESERAALDRSRRLAAERYVRYESEHHTVSAAERHSRYVDELAARYEQGYDAGYAAAHAAAERELASEAECHVPRRAPEDSSSTRRSRISAGAPAASDAPSSQQLDAAATDTANLASAESGAPAVDSGQPGFTADAPTPKSATFDTTQAIHRPPVTMEASLLMLREPVPQPLRGSLASLERQNQMLDAEGLQRIEDDTDLENRIADKLLVPLPVSEGLIVNPSLPSLRRYCRPWTAQFLTDLARIHDALFHRPLQVDSAVRPVSYQRQLMRINGNAAPAEGDIASPHETGATIDIAKKGMTWREIGWMRRYLLTLQNAGLIDVEEEFDQACFHITVYKPYAPPRPLRRAVDTASAATGTQGQ